MLPLPSEQLTASALRRQFSRLQAGGPLIWQPEMTADGLSPASATLKDAAVLLALVNRDDQLDLLLTVRSLTLNNHRGQIAFPGGRVDPGDGGAIGTALREAREEIGLEAPDVDILGQLPRYVTGTGYAVTPVVGLVEQPQALDRLRLEPAEVAEVFVVPLRFLMDPANHRRHRFQWRDGDVERERHFFSMPWRPPMSADREYFIWGATAAMLRNPYRFLAAK